MEPGHFHHDFGHGYPGMSLWWPLLIWAANLLWPILLALIALAVIRVFGEPKPERVEPPPPEPTAMELLRQRYVLGDIDAGTFEDMVSHVLRSEQREREQAFLRALPPYAQPQPEQPTRQHVYPAD